MGRRVDLANRQEIIIKNMKDTVCLLRGVAIRPDRYVIQKVNKEALRHRNVRTHIQQMRNMECFAISATTAATEIVRKEPKEYLERIS
jgi:predicted metallo-beta-lactamase superfamily hydrolase